MSKRPDLYCDKANDGRVPWDQLPKFNYRAVEYTFPHCDPRVLHLPSECMYCAAATELQDERAREGVSNTGHANRAWPCPADHARSSQSLNSWSGNRPWTADQLKERDEAIAKEAEELAKMADEEDRRILGILAKESK